MGEYNGERGQVEDLENKKSSKKVCIEISESKNFNKVTLAILD